MASRRQRRKQLLNKAGSFLFVKAQRMFLRRDTVGAERLGARLGGLAYRLDRKHRERTLANLALAFPEWSEERRREVSVAVFRHFGIVAADFLRSPKRTDQEVLASIEVEGQEHYEDAHAQGQGVIAITAHLGNWERFAHWCTATGRQISVVARDADEAGMNSLVGKIREAAGIEVLSRGNSARAILSKLRKNEIVGILPDQNSNESFVPFFGRPCGTVLGPAVLHLRTKAPLVPSYCVRIGPGRYRVEVMPPVVESDHGGDPERIMAALNLALEDIVRRYPDQYLWMHDRWKSARRRGLI